MDLGESAELSLDVVKVEAGYLFVENLGQDVDTYVKLAGPGKLNILLAESLVPGLVQHDLGQNLVGEGAGHDERRVTSGTAEVDKTTLSKQNDVAAILHQESVNLRLDVLHGLSIGLEPGNVDLDVEVANICENSLATQKLAYEACCRGRTYCRR